MSQSTIQETITDILKKHDKSAVGKLTKALIQKIIGTLEIEVSGQKKVLAKAIVDFIGADKFTVCTSGKSKDVEKLKDEIKHAFKEARDDDDDDDDEEDDGESVVEVEDGSNKRKREEVSEEDVKRFKAYEQIIDAKIAQMKLEKAETERVLQQLAAESEVRKYTDTIYTPLPTTNSSLLTEYENLRKDSAFTMKIANLFPEIDDTKKMVANLETRAFQLQVQAVNPELASKLAFIESNPLWRENMDKLKMAEKLLKFDHKEKGKTSFVKSYANAKIYDKKDKAEEKVNMFGSANGMKKVKKCFICNDPNHLIKDCPKRNKREGSEYVDDLFFPRGRRKKRGYSFHFEQMGYLEEERSFNGNSGYVERGCISSNKRRICSILWKGKFRRMVFGRERMVKKRSEYFERDWSFGTLSQSKSDSQVSAGPKERIIPTDYRFKTAQSVLFYPQIQVQHVEEVFRTRTNEQDRSNLGFYVRYEIRISPDEGKKEGQTILCHSSRGRGFAIHSPSIWMEWISILFYTNDECIYQFFEIRFFNTIQLLRRCWFITFWFLFICIKEQYIRYNGMCRIRCSYRKEEESVNSIKSLSTTWDQDRSGQQEINYDRSYIRENSNSYFHSPCQVSPRSESNIQRTVSDDWYYNCLCRLFPTCKGDVESDLFFSGGLGEYWRLGFRISHQRPRCNFQSPMDFIQLGPLEWKGVPISKLSGILLDRCIEIGMGSFPQRKKFETTRFLEGRTMPRTYQCIRSESDLSCPKRMVTSFERKEFNCLHGFKGGSILYNEGKSKVSHYESIDSTNMAHYFRTRHPFAFVRMVTFGGESSSGQSEQKYSRERPNRLGDYQRSFSISREAAGCINRMGQIRLSLQLQDKTIYSEKEDQQKRESRFILSPLDRASGKLVLRTFQSNRESITTLSRVQSSYGIGSSSMEKEVVVEDNRKLSNSFYESRWKSFQSLPRREPRTMQRILDHKSNISRLQSHDLSKIADTLMSCSIEISTTDNYESYWNRFINFLIKQKEVPPATSEMVVRFLTFMFIKTPSGNNCRSAMYAIKHFCKRIGWEDITVNIRVQMVIKGMCNLATVATKRERDPWRIEFICKWVIVGRQFVKEKSYVLYTCLMIFGIRSMFRGSELGGLLIEDLKIVKFPVVGFSITVRKVKNDKKGRKSCIEATGSELCPMKWLQKLLDSRDKGKFLFTGGFSLNTVEISYILTQVATWIEADPGKYSSHSLRIGGATEAAIMGIPDATIKAMGGWNSDAIDRYFRANFRGDRNGSHLMGF